MRLRIITPCEVVVDEAGVRSLQAEDASGHFGILPGHAPFLTSLALSIVRFERANGSQAYCAVRRGALTVSASGELLIATREAVLGTDLARLGRDVLARMVAELDLERTERAEAMRLELGAIRQLIQRMRDASNAVRRGFA